MNRAYSLVTVRGLDDEQRIIEGTASHISVDKVGDIVEPMGMRLRKGGPPPLLWQHRADSPVGRVEMIQPTATEIPFRARIEKSDRPGKVKELLDQAWDSVRLRLVRAVSIGFSPIKAVPIATGFRFQEWFLEELSLCTIPAQEEATIQTVKRLDRAALAALKPFRVVRLSDPVPGASGPFVIRKIHVTGTSRNDPSRPVASAMGAVLDRHQERMEEAARLKKLGGQNVMLIDLLTEGAKATDAELAALRARLEKLERGR